MYFSDIKMTRYNLNYDIFEFYALENPRVHFFKTLSPSVNPIQLPTLKGENSSENYDERMKSKDCCIYHDFQLQ